MTVDVSKYASGEARPGKTTRDNKREKRLERNRESARKCRKKRKAFVGDLQTQCDTLGEENQMLQLENQRLLAMIKQLQNGGNTVILPESTHKRVKRENGVSMATDFSESAVHATNSQQLEDYSKLAISTTFLLLSMTMMQWTLAVVPMMMQSANHAAAAQTPRAPLRALCSLALPTRVPLLNSCTVISPA